MKIKFLVLFALFTLDVIAQPISVLHVAYEYKDAQVGGLGAVTKTLLPLQNSWKNGALIKASIILPGYDFLLSKYEKSLKPEGTVEHFFDGKMIESQIFSTKDIKVKIFFIAPFKPRSRLFELYDPKNIYRAFPHSEPQDRSTYFSSAVAAFAVREASSFDIVHLHQWQVGFVAPLIKQYYDGKNNPNLPKIFVTKHMHSPEQGILEGPEEAIKIGLPRSGLVNQDAEMTLNSDFVSAVSQAVYEEMCSKQTGFGLDHLFAGARALGFGKGITNAINIKDYTLAKVSAAADIFIDDDRPPQEWKQQLKTELKRRGFNIDPKRPLMLFIGRFSQEKGIDMLPIAESAAIENDINFAILGLKTEDKESQKIIETLADKSSQDGYPGNLVVLEGMERQQKDGNGMLFRAAADFMLIPSHVEACGLVPMEGFRFGSIAISSNVQGLKDTLIDFDYDERGRREGNAFTYLNDSSRATHLKNRIDHAIAFWNSINENVRSEIQTRIILGSSQYSWNNALLEYYLSYKKALQRVHQIK